MSSSVTQVMITCPSRHSRLSPSAFPSIRCFLKLLMLKLSSMIFEQAAPFSIRRAAALSVSGLVLEYWNTPLS